MRKAAKSYKEITGHLKKVFWPELGVGIVLDPKHTSECLWCKPEYADTLAQNPFFEVETLDRKPHLWPLFYPFHA